jgi:peptidoglycan/xylan/chitin deacetylase (PgdA/CDA1 family)
MTTPTTMSDASIDPADYLTERYLEGPRRPAAVRAYYSLKPLLPRSVQLALRRRYARRQARRAFPAWPIEPILVEQRDEEFRRRLLDSGAASLPFVGFWPEHHRFAAILTHDVEGPAGVRNIPRVLEVEQRHGFVSSWNFVAEWYPFDRWIFRELEGAGCEIGLHGLRHDGQLFSSRANFERQLPALRRYFDEWGAVGFRSPATHRNADWMPELGCLYDSSFPDTDPFEPQAGGCCSILPFFFDDLVELPITLVQDHTLWEILGSNSISAWIHKSEWIIQHKGLINLILHPDYALSRERLALYEEFLVFLKQQTGGWYALPRDVARWWRHRARLDVQIAADGSAQIVPELPDETATIGWAREENDRVVLEL